MPDDTDNLAPLLADLAKYGVGAAGAAGANAQTQAAYQAILKNLQDRFNDYGSLGPAGYKNLVPQQLGPSALGGIQPDAQARLDEQGSIAQLDDIAKSGGLTLADKQALNELQQTASRNAGARNASTANQYAARGQLGSGEQLAMELANNQNATANANRSGESIAAQAQQRAMDAVLKKGAAARSISNDDYARKKAAAEATDEIARHNAAMTTDAAKYNNNVAGQAYDDQLKKLAGEGQVTGQLNTALLGSGQQNANTTAGLTYGAGALIGGLGNVAKALPKGGAGGSGGGDDQNPDASGDRGGAADLSGGNTDTEETGSNPDDWAQWNGG